MITQAGTCPLGAMEQRATASWQGLNDSPFATFLAAFPSGDRYRSVMAQFALVEIIKEPTDPSAEALEINANDSGTDYPPLEDVSEALVAASMDEARDPEAAAILRLRAALANSSYMDALAQARKTAQDHLTCAFAHCVLSVFPDYVEGLKAAKKGLMCVSDDASPMLRRWLLWRTVVHGGLQGPSLAGRTIGGEGGDIRLGVALHFSSRPCKTQRLDCG